MSRDYYDFDDGDDWDEISELQAETVAERRHLLALLAHPDPRDPDYPGEFGSDE